MSDPATVEIAEMVLCGSINKGIASSIKRAGGRALGLSGKDDNLLVAKKLGKKIVDEETGEVKVKEVKGTRRWIPCGKKNKPSDCRGRACVCST